MSINRYASDNLAMSGKILGTNQSITKIRTAVQRGDLTVREIVLRDGERLDTIAGRYYGDGRLWWIIAAASNIGWWLQVPPGIRIVVPTDLNQILGIV